MAGAVKPGTYKPNYVKPPSPVQDAYNNQATAYKQQGQDYSDIMNKFRDLYDRAGNISTNGLDLNANFNIPSYQSTKDYTDAISKQKALAENGGYSPEDIANIRERGISPIRSVYQNAQRNVERQRALQGGYSPNFAVVSAKMAREMSSQLSDATTNINAQIAQQIAQNKIGATNAYAGTASHEQDERNNFELQSAQMGNSLALDKLGIQERLLEFPIQSRRSALDGMIGLYGTTPAWASLTQNGALNNAQLHNSITQGNRANGLDLLSRYMGA
jgi:hypothetical protein